MLTIMIATATISTSRVGTTMIDKSAFKNETDEQSCKIMQSIMQMRKKLLLSVPACPGGVPARRGQGHRLDPEQFSRLSLRGSSA